MKKTLPVIITLGVILLLGTLTSWVAPNIVRNYVCDNGEEILGRKIRINDLKANIFTGAISMEGLTVFEEDGIMPFIHLHRAETNLSMLHLLTGIIDLETLRLSQLDINIQQRDTVFNFTDILQRFSEEEEEEESDDCFAHICEFAGYNDIDIQELRQPIAQYIDLVDKEDKEDDARRIRKKASDVFYELYERAFFKSIKAHELSPVVEMFLHFGFMDIDAVGDEIADFFFEMTENIRLVSFGEVYTIYTWLMAIYKGEREPSRNELDLDYRGYITEERKNGNIPEDRVKHLLEDRTEKVKFEIKNFNRYKRRTRISSLQRRSRFGRSKH